MYRYRYLAEEMPRFEGGESEREENIANETPAQPNEISGGEPRRGKSAKWS